MKTAEFLILAIHLGAVYKRVKGFTDSRVSYLDNNGKIAYYTTKAGDWTEHLSPTAKSGLSKKKYRRLWPSGTIQKLLQKKLVCIVRQYKTHTPMLEIVMYGLTPLGTKVAIKLARSLKVS